MPISDVLSQLSQSTGVEIVVNKPPRNKHLTTPYVDKDIEQIVRDIFRGFNYALVWHKKQNGVYSIGISIFDNGGRLGADNLPAIRSPKPVIKGIWEKWT